MRQGITLSHPHQHESRRVHGHHLMRRGCRVDETRDWDMTLMMMSSFAREAEAQKVVVVVVRRSARRESISQRVRDTGNERISGSEDEERKELQSCVVTRESRLSRGEDKKETEQQMRVRERMSGIRGVRGRRRRGDRFRFRDRNTTSLLIRGGHVIRCLT